MDKILFSLQKYQQLNFIGKWKLSQKNQ